MSRTIYFILPMYNEAENLSSLLDKIKNLSQPGTEVKVIAVNDGSTDDSVEKLMEYKDQLPIHLIDHVVNKGLGITLLDGLTYAASISSSTDFIVTMDADDTHDPVQVQQMMAKMLTDELDLVIASRFRAGAQIFGLKQWRKILSYGAALIFILLRPLKGVRDYTCGYRLMKASSLKRVVDRFGDVFITERGFAATAQILLRCRTAGLSCGEVPLILHYDRKKGLSKMNIGKTVQRTIGLCYLDLFQNYQSLNK